jgi:O-methyltransferase
VAFLQSIRARLADARARRRLSPTARRVTRERLTYLSAEKLANLEWCAREVQRREVPGGVIEAGVALGGSAIALADELTPERAFDGYDVFGTIPPPSERDGADAHDRYEVIASGGSTGIDGDPCYEGCRAATDEFLAAHAALVPVRDWGNLVLRRG